jgi:hypothetical protein
MSKAVREILIGLVMNLVAICSVLCAGYLAYSDIEAW